MTSRRTDERHAETRRRTRPSPLADQDTSVAHSGGVDMRGLVTRDYQKDYPDSKHAMLLSGNVVRFLWKNIEPEPGVFNYGFIETVEGAAGHGSVKLRILGGSNSPAWLVDRCEPFPYVEGTSGRTHRMPRWWSDEYLHRWEYMMRVVEQGIGNLVEVVAQTGGGTVYGEPFIRSVWQNKDMYNRIGFDLTVDRTALDTFNDIVRKVWKGQQIAQSMFQWQHMADGQPRQSLDLSLEATARWQPDLVGAHDLRETPGAPRKEMWDRMAALGLPLYFQTARPSKIGDWRKALDFAVGYDTEYVELNRDLESYDFAELGGYGWQLG